MNVSQEEYIVTVPGPICTSPTDAAFYDAFNRLGWSWPSPYENNKGSVKLPDGQFADHGDVIKYDTVTGHYTIERLS